MEHRLPNREHAALPRTPIRAPRRLLLVPGLLQRLLLFLGSQRHLAPLRPGAGAERTAAAGQALAARELGMDHCVEYDLGLMDFW
jgi:hypothetical protein